MNIEDWHYRFEEQAAWSAQSRAFLLTQISMPLEPKIIEIGSGTGAVLSTFKPDHAGILIGLDLKMEFLRFNRSQNPGEYLVQADGLSAPFPTGFFNLTYCHYLMLWIKNPVFMINEMTRITKSKGWVAFFAEPDYEARIDFPSEFRRKANLQNQSLEQQGAKLTAGRQLASWMDAAGLQDIHWGINGAHQPYKAVGKTISFESLVYDNDISFLTSQAGKQEKMTLDGYQETASGRILFIPTFFAYGQKP